MKYLSLFSGIGGFELGIQQAYEDKKNRGIESNGEKEKVSNSKTDKSILKRKKRNFNNKKNSREIRTSKNSSGALFQNRQIKSNTKSENLERTEKDIKFRQQMGQGSDELLRERNGIRNGKKVLQQQGIESDIRTWTTSICIGYSEIDKYAIQIYKKHFPKQKNYGDITKINVSKLPDFDMLTGGFPCQSFSIAGKRGGFEDTRGTLFFEIARIAKAKRPCYLFLENVKGLLSHDEGNTFATIITTLDELGYDCQWQVLNSKNFGVPQNRERVFIIGHLRGTSRPKVFPIGNESKAVAKKPRVVGNTNKNKRERGNVYSRNGIVGALTATDYKQPKQVSLKEITNQERQGKRVYDINGLSRTIAAEGGGWGAKTGLYVVSPTIDTTWSRKRITSRSIKRQIMKTGLIRRLTPTECERLQSFPDGWTEGLSDTQRYKTLGNAVTVNVIKAIMERLVAQQ